MIGFTSVMVIAIAILCQEIIAYQVFHVCPSRLFLVTLHDLKETEAQRGELAYPSPLSS